jgi:hypothetical protein
MEEARRRWGQARARLDELQTAVQGAKGFGYWDGLRAAESELLAAEREMARAAGGEHAVELDIELPWDIGAPLPQLLANDYRTFLVFHLSDPDPDWDGTWSRVVDPAVDVAVPLGVVEFRYTESVRLGGPNDEAITGHPLYGKGLRAYAAHQVLNSRWITEAERVNSFHPQHRGGWHDRLNHYVFCFHDSTFECLAEGFTTQRFIGSPRAVLSELVGRLLD